MVTDCCPFITISRQAGAGGCTVADAVAALLAQDRDLAGPAGWQVHDADVDAGGGVPVPAHRAFHSVRELATAGHGVIVGRGGVMLTRDLPQGVHVRLIAPREVRIDRLSARHHIDREQAFAAIGEQDASRARLFREYFQREIDDPSLYDAVFNTARLPAASIAAAIAQMVRDRVSAL